MLHAMVKDEETRSIMDSLCPSMSMEFLDVIGWMIRIIKADGPNTGEFLSELGSFYDERGITMRCYSSMFMSVHETFSLYFPSKYAEDVQFAMDK